MLIFRFILSVLLAGMLFAACDELPQEKTLVMGTSADYKPFEFVDNGEIVGFDVDIARAIVAELGYKLTVKDMDFSSLIPALNSQHIDFAMASINPTPDREKYVDFSDIYYKGPVTMLVKLGSNIRSFADLQNKTVGVQLGTTWEILAKEKQKSVAGLQVFLANKIPQLIEELKIGRLDAVLIEQQQAEDINTIASGIEFVILPEMGGGNAIAFAKGSKLVAQFNQALAKLNDSGEMENIKQKWLQ